MVKYGCVDQRDKLIINIKRGLYFTIVTFLTCAGILTSPAFAQDYGPPKYTSGPNPPIPFEKRALVDRIVDIDNEALKAEQSNDCQKAVPLYMQAYETRLELSGPTRPAYKSLMGAASCLSKIKDYAAALDVGEKVWRGRQYTYGTHAKETYQSLEWLVSIAKEFAEASQSTAPLENIGRYYAEMYVVKWFDLGALHPRTYKGFIEAGISKFEKGSKGADEAVIGRAMILLEQALLRNQELGQDRHLNLVARDRYVRGLLMRGHINDAEYISSGTVELAKKLHGASHPKTISYMLQYVEILSELGLKRKALEFSKLAFDNAKVGLGENHRQTILLQYQYRNLSSELENTADALARLTEAVAAVESEFGPIDTHSLEALSSLAFQNLQLDKAAEANRLNQLVLKRAQDNRFRLQKERVFMGNLAKSRLHLPETKHLADETMGGFHTASHMRHEEIASNPEQVVRIARSNQDMAEVSKLGLNTLWESARHKKKRPSDSNYRDVGETFMFAQDVFKAGASGAIAETAARRLVERQDPTLGALARKRQSLFEKYRSLHSTTVSRIALSAPDKPKLIPSAGAEERRELIRIEIEKIDQRLLEEAPGFFYMMFPGPLSGSETMATLRSDEAILFLIPTEFGTHSYLVWKGGGNWHRSPLTAQEIAKPVQRLLWDVGASVEVNPADEADWLDEADGKYTFDRKTAHMLYNELIKPHAEILKSKTHLFVAADGPLQSLPLSMLVVEPPVGADHDPESLRSTAWFADSIATVSIPSVNAWKLLRRQNRQAGLAPQFAGFGDPLLEGQAQSRGSGLTRRLRGSQSPSISKVFDRVQSRSGNSSGVLTDSLRGLSRLPGTAEELEAIRLALNAPQEAVIMGNAATEAAVKTADLSRVDILAFATHGLVAGEVKGASEPGLVLTPPAKASAGNDGLLTATEVSRLDLRADWVILSACNTAAGDGSEGAAGFSGLAQAFFLAGAGNLLASHWPVRDDVAALLTVRTIEIHRDNPELSKAQSFHQAMREIRNDASADSEIDSWAHPNAWAPFVIIGDR